MESLGEILKRTGTNISKADTDTWSSVETSEELSGAEACPICKGAGFVHPSLPSGRSDFTRVIPCQCNPGESKEGRLSRLRRDSGGLELELLRTMTFDNFDRRRVNLPLEEQENLEWAFNESRKFAEAPKDWVVFLGSNGCGKTHLAAAIGNYQLQQGKPVIFVFVPDLLDHLRATFSPDSKVTYDELFERVKQAPLLILDDFGEQAATPWAQEKLYQLINHRYNDRLPTVITTCLALENMETRIASRLADPRLVSVVNIMAPDYRSDLTASERGKRQAQRGRRSR